MGSKIREWTLDDGSVHTVRSVMSIVGCSQGTAYARLSKSTDNKHILRPREKHKIHGGQRVYILDDGSGWTSRRVAEVTGCSPSTASTRLSCYSDAEHVLAPPKDKVNKELSVKKHMQERMFFDPLGHWKLINSCT